MNTAAVAAIIALGIGVAINPPGVSLVILLLMSKGGKRKAWAYVAGSITAESLIIFAVLALISVAGDVTVNPAHTQSPRGDLVALLTALFGVSLIVTGVFMLTKGSSGTNALVERAVNDVDNVPLWLAFVIGLTLVSWTMPMVVAAEIAAASDPLTLSAILALYVTFMAFAMSTVIAPILIATVWPDKSQDLLGRAREWLEVHGGQVAAVVTIVFGLVFASRGIAALLG